MQSDCRHNLGNKPVIWVDPTLGNHTLRRKVSEVAYLLGRHEINNGINVFIDIELIKAKVIVYAPPAIGQKGSMWLWRSADANHILPIGEQPIHEIRPRK
jgi:hypothetical protein